MSTEVNYEILDRYKKSLPELPSTFIDAFFQTAKIFEPHENWSNYVSHLAQAKIVFPIFRTNETALLKAFQDITGYTQWQRIN